MQLCAFGLKLAGLMKGMVFSMHEMGVMLNIVDEVEAVAKANEVKRIYKLVLEVGALTGVMPNYMQDCWFAVRDQFPLFADCELVMEEVDGIGRCGQCGEEFDLVKYNGKCPQCQASKYSVLSGGDLIIKEIAAE